MAESSQLLGKSISHFSMKIDVVKFDSTNNFGMWRYKVMDALTESNLEDSLRLEEKLEETSEKDWDKLIRMVCGAIKSYLLQDIKYHMLYETSARKFGRSSRRSCPSL